MFAQRSYLTEPRQGGSCTWVSGASVGALARACLLALYACLVSRYADCRAMPLLCAGPPQMPVYCKTQNMQQARGTPFARSMHAASPHFYTQSLHSTLHVNNIARTTVLNKAACIYQVACVDTGLNGWSLQYTGPLTSPSSPPHARPSQHSTSPPFHKQSLIRLTPPPSHAHTRTFDLSHSPPPPARTHTPASPPLHTYTSGVSRSPCTRIPPSSPPLNSPLSLISPTCSNPASQPHLHPTFCCQLAIPHPAERKKLHAHAAHKGYRHHRSQLG